MHIHSLRKLFRMVKITDYSFPVETFVSLRSFCWFNRISFVSLGVHSIGLRPTVTLCYLHDFSTDWLTSGAKKKSADLIAIITSLLIIYFLFFPPNRVIRHVTGCQ